METKKKFMRSRTNKSLGGVLGGLSEYLDIDVTVVRLIYCALTLFTAAFPGILLYIVALLIVPLEPEK